jgi:hypothetical protein
MAGRTERNSKFQLRATSPENSPFTAKLKFFRSLLNFWEKYFMTENPSIPDHAILSEAISFQRFLCWKEK